MSIESLLRKKAEQQKQLESEKPQLEIVPANADTPNQPNIPNITNITNITKTHNQPNLTNHINPARPLRSVSPSNDYAKVPNSIVRVAVPERYFKGMSKNTYDALYLKTRGAINPIRKIRATKSDLIRWTGVSDVTIDKHIRHLKSVGLLKVEFVIGSHEGNWYEVYIPEEIVEHNNSNQPNQPNQPNIYKKVGSEVPNLVGDVGRVEAIENKGFNETPKTSLKTNNKNDDEATAALVALMEIGKGKPKDWLEFAELIKMEFNIAAARTKSVSNAPAFLTEHLRRRLMPVKREVSKSKPNKTLQVGKQQPTEQSETYAPEPLTKEGRESTLKTFAGYMKKGQKDFLMSLEDTYTKEDWEWIMNQIKTE